ncbi:hypothetical protein P153DRAFT_380070 [Dothidotthia symphoricarpi CBS 119687]|uniref:BZIP domain-containing protein n=1 Tax=Dothidotthia symphoricarpi CBS 119687 TaxID=1392245 RepID=A0A6A5ZVW6_9PLEO|nr:uncharacterized protein P153DRAFT_380070 [Dothidotthia symphoricarpi CBS 119687]KAF2123436.1 hypothetical protein P153DRAFT_380070 [Dothidotthia symphoricarpi CBS 119687]
MANSNVLASQRTTVADMWVRDEDDWSGISDTKRRRKIQNRRNQRMHRSRKRTEVECGAVAISKREQPVPIQTTSTLPLITPPQSPADSEIEAITEALKCVNILNPKSEYNRKVLQDFEALAYQYWQARMPLTTLLPSLSRFNFTRALLANIEVLGISSEQMSDEATSPFNLPGFHEAEESKSLVARLPAGLRPTDLQCASLHHPWIDLLPVPEMRNNIFRRGFDAFDEEELCHALRDLGILVWSDPWDPSGWEVTETFVKSWSWVLVGCLDLFRSTNKWRARRGEKPLFRLPS